MKYLKSILAVAMAVALAFSPSLAFAETEFSANPNAHPGDKGFVLTGVASVASTTVSVAGTGYTSLPTVAFSGGTGGVQATGTATLKVVGSVTVTAGGTGHTVGDVLTLVGGTKTTAMTGTVATVSSGVVTAVTLTNAGVYTVPVTTTGAATTSSGSGTGCTLTVGYGVAGITLVTTGKGYLTAPTIAFSGGAGASAAATATLGTTATTADFDEITPLANAVISSITFATRVAGGRPLYAGDTSIIGKTLTAGTAYKVYGTAITLTSGHALLRLR